MRRSDLSSVICLLSMLLVACKSGPIGRSEMSVKEAENITARFDQRSFNLPPRSIEDVTQLLRPLDSKDRSTTEKLRQQADKKVPTDLSSHEQAEALWLRARAANEIGRTQQALDDLGKALHLGATDHKLMSKIHMAYSHTHANNGNMAEAIRQRQLAVQQVLKVDGYILGKISRHAALTTYLAFSGDFQNASENLERTNQFVDMARENSYGKDWRYLVPMHEAMALIAKANVEKARGRYSGSIEIYRSALVLIDQDISTDARADVMLAIYDTGTSRRLIRHVLHMNFISSLIQNGNFAEAEVIARENIKAMVERFGRNSIYSANSLVPLIAILGRTERYTEAKTLADIALEILSELGADRDGYSLNIARHTLADAYIANSDWSKALALYSEIFEATKGSELIQEKLLRYDLNYATVLLQSQRHDDAYRIASDAVRRWIEVAGENHFETAEATGLVGVAQFRQGQTSDALKKFRKAFPTLIKHNLEIATDNPNSGSRQRFEMITEAYLAVLSEKGDEESIKEAFQVANAARLRSVQRALARSIARAQISDPVLGNLARREQDAREQVGALFAILSNSMLNGGQSKATLKSEIASLNAARLSLLEEINTKFPDYAELVNPAPTSLDAARESLLENEALLSFYVTESTTYIWAFSSRGHIEFHVAPIGGDSLENAVAKLRSALDPDVSLLSDIPEYDVNRAFKLYQTLLHPVARAWKTTNTLVVVPHRDLAQIPLGILPVHLPPKTETVNLPFIEYQKVPWLARSQNIMVLPNVGSLIPLRSISRLSDPQKPFIGFGDPIFRKDQFRVERSPLNQMRGEQHFRGLVRVKAMNSLEEYTKMDLSSLPRLPDTKDELLEIARVLNADSQHDLFFEERATEKTVKDSDLSRYRIISFATHGLVSGDLDGLSEPALALSNPDITGDNENDGLLTASEILGLKLSANLAVLSACNTAAGIGNGAETVSGLGRSFFYAGARSLLVSNWPVHSEATKILMSNLFGHLAAARELSRAEALKHAQLELINRTANDVVKQTGTPS